MREPGLFGFDPFLIESNGDRRTPENVEEMKQKFLNAYVAFGRWRRRKTLMSESWHTFFGTTHERTRNLHDVSFLQWTAQMTLRQDVPPDTLVPLQRPPFVFAN
jgi:hypothetical protein